jgi:hypothetical protein
MGCGSNGCSTSATIPERASRTPEAGRHQMPVSFRGEHADRRGPLSSVGNHRSRHDSGRIWSGGVRFNFRPSSSTGWLPKRSVVMPVAGQATTVAAVSSITPSRAAPRTPCGPLQVGAVLSRPSTGRADPGSRFSVRPKHRAALRPSARTARHVRGRRRRHLHRRHLVSHPPGRARGARPRRRCSATRQPPAR